MREAAGVEHEEIVRVAEEREGVPRERRSAVLCGECSELLTEKKLPREAVQVPHVRGGDVAEETATGVEPAGGLTRQCPENGLADDAVRREGQGEVVERRGHVFAGEGVGIGAGAGDQDCHEGRG